jgi:hypothetical protein
MKLFVAAIVTALALITVPAQAEGLGVGVTVGGPDHGDHYRDEHRDHKNKVIVAPDPDRKDHPGKRHQDPPEKTVIVK